MLMSDQNILQQLKSIIRKLESIKYKPLRCKWCTIFNKILPDYTRMRYIKDKKHV